MSNLKEHDREQDKSVKWVQAQEARPQGTSTIPYPGGSNPDQYSLPTGAKEIQDLIEYREMNFAQGNMFKAVYRQGYCEHSDAARDLRKIIWFAKRELKRIGADHE